MGYPEIIFDAERMKYDHTGIYHYCYQLGKELLNQQSKHQYKLGFYLPPNVSDIFGKDIYKITQNSLHKFRMPSVEKYKVWHATYQGTNYFPSKSKNKIAFTIHDLNFLYEKSGDKQKKYLGILQKKIHRADALIAISNFVKKEIENNLDIGNKKIEVIYNGCNILPTITPAKPTLKINAPFLFAIGAITPKKNFHILPAAIANNDHHLLIAGVVQDKDYFNKIMGEASKLGVQNRVHYLGAVKEPEKYWLMQNCSLFCFPSLAEGFGLPVIEAMRFGKPVLLSKATSLPEIGGDLAYYLESYDFANVSHVANYALNHYSNGMIQKTIDWSYRFNWQDAAAKYWDIYENLCSQ